MARAGGAKRGQVGGEEETGGGREKRGQEGERTGGGGDGREGRGDRWREGEEGTGKGGEGTGGGGVRGPEEGGERRTEELTTAPARVTSVRGEFGVITIILDISNIRIFTCVGSVLSTAMSTLC